MRPTDAAKLEQTIDFYKREQLSALAESSKQLRISRGLMIKIRELQKIREEMNEEII